MLMAATLLCGAAAALALWLVRRRATDGASRDVVRRVAMVASWLFAVSVALTTAQLSLAALRGTTHEVEAYPPVLLGAAFGLLLFLHVRVLLMELGRWTYLWASRAPERFDRSWRMEARAVLWGAVGFAGAGAILGTLVSLDPGAWSFLLVPLVVAVLPIYETWLSPWLQFWRARRLADTPHAELDAWLADINREGRVPRFHVRVHEGKEKNAYAMGGLFRNLVVLGGGLVTGMTTAQLRAVLAHEVAHVIRRDVLKLLVTIIAGGTCHVAILANFVNPYTDSGTAGLLLGALYVGVAAPLAYIVLPGFVGRRLEYGADRLAAELLRDPEAMVNALARLHELRDTPLDKRSISHPTGRERIRALRELASPGAAT